MVDFQWLIGGEAGYGIMTTGAMMGKIFTRLGLSVFDYTEYPSLIRGGHNAYYVRASDTPIYSQKQKVDILVALNDFAVTKHLHELTENAAIIYDPTLVNMENKNLPQGIIPVPVPLVEIARKEANTMVMINTVTIGASLALVYEDYSVLENILQETFGKKGETIIAENINTSKAGFDHVLTTQKGKSHIKISPKPQENLYIHGAEAVTFGAIRAGVKFGAIYPMTPTNGVLANLAAHALKYNIVVKEPEDEISGINMAIGASYAGVRSLCATSGGGFALMSEAFGLAAQTEVPLVVIMGMRPGPATGMPTWTGQGDVRFVLHAGQDDFPRIVLAPGDHLEAFEFTMKAFNLAEKYQLPVIVLVDKYLMEGHMTVNAAAIKKLTDEYKIDRGKLLTNEQAEAEEDYKRYLITDDGISPRSIPGQKGGIALTGSDEHNEKGLYNEDDHNRIQMMDKRFRKLVSAQADIPQPQFYGWDDPEITIISFGSNKLPIFEAMKWLKKEGIHVNYLQVSYLSPFPEKEVAAVMQHAKKTLVIEANKTGQFEGLIREHTGLSVDHHLRKYNGRPFYPEEIVGKVKSLVHI
jgi:2-oxoglutarate/2-oxoacid ferredoxin oxidoreductase subunit alpha